MIACMSTPATGAGAAAGVGCGIAGFTSGSASIPASAPALAAVFSVMFPPLGCYSVFAGRRRLDRIRERFVVLRLGDAVQRLLHQLDDACRILGSVRLGAIPD